jgi:hypothetical protein
LILFTHHDAFDLRSLEGTFIVFVGPCLVDNCGGTSLAWDSLGNESHKLDTMAHTPYDDDSIWRLERHLREPTLSLHHPNDFPMEARALHLGT